MLHTHDEGYVHTKEKQIKTLADFKGLKMPRADAADQQAARQTRRSPRCDALARRTRGDVEGRDRWLPAAVGGDPEREAA
jgi:hypothetical protein